MVELGFSTNAYTEYSVFEAVDRIANHGYAGVEVLADTPHAFLTDFGESDRKRLADTIAEHDIAVTNINANTVAGYYDDAPPEAFFEPSIITDNDDHRRWRIEYTKDALDLADRLGAPAVCIATGRPLGGNLPETAYATLIDSLHEILDHADAVNVDLGIEFEPELLVECVDEVLELIDAVDRERLGVNLDIGHVAVAGDDPATSIRRCEGRITGLHLEDIVGGVGGKHYHRIPGDGDLDFAAIFAALYEIDYDGYATLELYTYPHDPDRAARESLAYLQDFLD